MGTPLSTGDRVYNGAVSVGYAFPLGPVAHVQPYLGARAATTGSGTLGGLNYGAVAYVRPTDSFGWFLNATGTSVLGTSLGGNQGTFLGGASTGLEFYLSPKLAVTAEVGYGLQPAFLAPAAAGTTTDGALMGTLGLELGF
jgi:hypothetical protein